tara:strand:+ start:2168 stop:3382 length:1215 start_codon:yes stop_codon:yes gene_type:complete
MKAAPPTPPCALIDDAADDAFTRWFVEQIGLRPTPEMRRKFYAPVMRLVMWSEADHDRWLGDELIKSNPDQGVEPFDADVEVAAAKSAGVDISDNPDLAYLRRVTEEARTRRADVRPPRHDPRKALRAIAKDLEARLRRERRRAEVAFRGRKSVSRKSREKWRRDEKRDAKIISEIQGFFEVEVGVRMASSEAALVRSKKSLEGPGAGETAIVFPHWEKSSEVIRSFGMAAGAGALGARDFTIHMNDAVLDYASGADGQSFAKRMLRRITDALGSKFGAVGVSPPGVMFFVEQGKGERPHLHGVVMIPSYPEALNIVRDALKQAAGSPWKKTATVDTQVDIGGLPEPVGWVDYITKFKEVTKAHLGSNTFAASQSMRAIGREWYAKGRREGRLLLPRKAVAIIK